MPPEDPIRIGVSSCLLGAEVRFDGQHKRDGFLVGELGKLVEFVAVCPEVELGMGIPREPVRLVRGPHARSLMLGVRSNRDWTEKMERFARRRVRKLADLSGYVLKSRSPSCGMERVKLYSPEKPDSHPTRDGVGLYAAALMAAWPNLPIEEEGRLADPRLRENFIERVFAYHRVRALWATRWTVGQLVAFHTAHKMALLAHSTEGYRRLGRLVAGASKRPRADVASDYEAGFMGTLRKVASPGRHANVLMHMLGHLRERLDDRDRAELLALVEDHRKGLVPLIVPITLLKHHVVRLGVTYLLGQTYLEPHPRELMLRNRV